MSRSGAEVIGVDCGEMASVCTARVRVEFSAGAMLGREPAQVGKVESTHLEERWIMEDGVWWLYLAPGK